MIEVYPDKAGEWRWRRKAANGKVTGDSGEGYEARGSGIEAARAEAEPGERLVLLRADDSVVGELDGVSRVQRARDALAELSPEQRAALIEEA